MVLAGDTTRLEPVTGPIPEMERLVAPFVTQVRLLLCPSVIEVELALKVLMVGAGGLITVTGVVDVLVVSAMLFAVTL